MVNSFACLDSGFDSGEVGRSGGRVRDSMGKGRDHDAVVVGGWVGVDGVADVAVGEAGVVGGDRAKLRGCVACSDGGHRVDAGVIGEYLRFAGVCGDATSSGGCFGQACMGSRTAITVRRADSGRSGQ
ncbi:hypothetical protein [Embleya hyalina]|uniref:hypothetical protein n=1 Tax=Embleya hyalina TaxID=516124 RepID=UPI000F8403E9|nr:hypothetical protein [Embleya hyalina]